MSNRLESVTGWLSELENDLIEQFRGQPNIQIFNKAVARQFKELHAFFYQLYTLQWIWEAEGTQLEGIGNIVNLSRTEALIWSNLAGFMFCISVTTIVRKLAVAF